MARGKKDGRAVAGKAERAATDTSAPRKDQQGKARADAPDAARPPRKRGVGAAPMPAHLHTRVDREAAGRALRERCPREAHATLPSTSGRADPIDMLLADSKGRVERLIPIRFGRMVASPFAFFRGTAGIMAADLATTPSTGYLVHSCGDAHLMNFGAFATPERRVIFDINDFDETYPAPWEWDLKRLATSFVLASLANGHRPSDARAAARRVVQDYAAEMTELAGRSVLDAWYSYLDYNELIEETDDSVLRRRRRHVLRQATQRTATSEFVKLAHFVDGEPRIRESPPLVYHPSDDEEAGFDGVIRENFTLYRDSLPPDRRVLFDRYALTDVAMKVVGVGSVGLVCAIGLFFASDGDVLFLQVKQVGDSVLQPAGAEIPYASHGERVVVGQRIMQAASDVFLGHMVGVRGRHFYVRQLRDVKVRPMVEVFTPANMRGFARNCARALARAHARSGDPAIIAGYIGRGSVLADAIATFSIAYADQAVRDHGSMVEAIRTGAIEATFQD
jgi:uncharacterized protein (DUF2252 family)